MVLTRFIARLGKRDLASISQEEALEFLFSLTMNSKQATKRNRYSVLAAFSNFIINSAPRPLTNQCNTPISRKIFKWPQAIQGNILDKKMINAIIFCTVNTRNRLMLALMARGEMRVGKVLNLTPADFQERSLGIQNP